MIAPSLVSLIRPDLLAVAGLGMTAGLFIGSIGVGGVIIVPVLVQAGYPISVAIAVAMAGYILTGLVGTWAFMRHGTLDRTLVWPLCAGAMPAAIVGALSAQVWPPAVLELIIASMTALSGLHALIRRTRTLEARPRVRSKTSWAVIGAFAGFVSALTGTGGPAALIPLLLWMDVPTLTTLGLAQVIQLPIALLATAGNIAFRHTDLALGAALGIGLAVGARLGVALAHALDPRLLRRLVALVLLGVGLFLFARILLTSSST